MFKIFHIIKNTITNVFTNKDESIIRKYDSRLDDNLHNYCSYPPQKICELLEFYINKTEYRGCFLNSIFMRDVFPYISPGATFYNCTFEINIENNFSIYDLGLYTYVNCKFYIKNFEKFKEDILIGNNLHAIKFILNSLVNKKSKVFSTSYFEYLLKKHNNNLEDLDKWEYNGLSLYNLDLSNATLPKDRNFFKDIAFSSVENCILPYIDFNEYNVFDVYFKNTVFNKNSILTDDMLKNCLYGCTLPIINFEKYNRVPYINIQNCIFHSETIFPNDKSFFIGNKLQACVFPNNDYSEYIIRNHTLTECYFGNNAILPELITSDKYINCLNFLKNIPDRYLNLCVKYLTLKNPEDFIKQYRDRLTEQEIFLIYKKHIHIN